jgi:hypothetical protein
MKQVLQHARTGEIAVEDVPAPQLLSGCVLVRIAASLVLAGTERDASEFARKNLLQKAQSRPDLVRGVINKVKRNGIFSALQSVRGRLDQSQSPGYSSAGTVLAVGVGVTDRNGPHSRNPSSGIMNRRFASRRSCASRWRHSAWKIRSQPEIASPSMGRHSLHGLSKYPVRTPA